MAFFKFRKGGDEKVAPPSASESVEAMRTRARHRLIGASVLVLAGVIGFPLVFDSQPRPVSVDIPIEIPDKQAAKPLEAPVAVVPASQVVVEIDAGKDVTPAVAASVPAATKAAVAAPAASRVANGAVVAPPAAAVAKPAPKVESKPEPRAVDKKPAEKAAETAPTKPSGRADDGAKAQALLEGKDLSKAASAAGRYVVQIGAYADATKAHEVRVKLERAGFKTYTQVVQPKEGKRIRVRVGPFESKAEADKTVERVKKLDLTASVLEL